MKKAGFSPPGITVQAGHLTLVQSSQFIGLPGEPAEGADARPLAGEGGGAED